MLGIVAAVALSLPLEGQVEWLPLRLDNDKKAVAYFPGVILQVSDTINTALGLMPFTTYYVQDDEAVSGNRLYMLTVIDYPEGAFPVDSAARREDFFQNSMLAAAESVGGEIKFSEPIDKPTTGYIFRIDYGEERPTVVRNHAYLQGNRYYHQQVFSFMDDGGERSRKRFFDNFYAKSKKDSP